MRLNWHKLANIALFAGTTLLASALVRMWPNGHMLAQGAFHQVAHKGSGEARIYRLPDGSFELAIRSFKTAYVSNLDVFMVATSDAPNNQVVMHSEHINLGRIASATSTWNAILPPGLDLNRFRAVAIWSPKYQVNFIAAPLVPPVNEKRGK